MSTSTTRSPWLDRIGESGEWRENSGFRSARVSRPRRSADRRSPRDAPTVGDWDTCVRRGRRSGDHCPNQLVQDPLFTGTGQACGKEKSRKPEFREPSTPLAEGASHFLAPGERGWPLPTPPHEIRCLRLHWPPAVGHPAEPDGLRATSAFWSSPPGKIGFVFPHPPRPFLTQVLAIPGFALIPNWLCSALFVASSRRQGGTARRHRPVPVGLPRAHLRGTRFRSCQSSNHQ